MHELSEVAEHILTATSLEEKLRFSPELGEITDGRPKRPLHLPEKPGRPKELEVTAKGARPDFPSAQQLDQAEHRAVMLHFLCNHELLATELMALVLLKFPDAPAAFRLGVYDTLREEQAHTLMYLRRIKECGMEFGELPVNDYFWRTIAPMETPMDFVSRLSLTFEQANLDFSKHFAKIFRQVGDAGTAAVLEKIYRDEIGHVGHGLKWFREWKDPGESDWQAFSRVLSFPLHPSKAKGLAPFNASGRLEAGLDEDFVRRLRLSEQSRGRTPVLHWMNPLAEAESLAQLKGRSFQPSEAELSLHQDLNQLAWISCKRDDAALVTEMPSLEHLERLQGAGFSLPEFLTRQELGERKVGGLSPWAWSPDATRMAQAVSPRFAKQVPADLFSQSLGDRLNQSLGLGSRWVDSEEALEAALEADPDAFMKAPFSSAGRGTRRADSTENRLAWARKIIRQQGGLLVEPYLDIEYEFSALYDCDSGQRPRFLGFTHLLTDGAGRYLGTRVLPKWSHGFPAEVTHFLFAQARIQPFYQETLPAHLEQVLPDSFSGPLAIDWALHHDASGALAHKAVIEVNPRRSMGRLAFDLFRAGDQKKTGHFQIHRLPLKAPLPPESLPLNDPARARRFLATWTLEP